MPVRRGVELAVLLEYFEGRGGLNVVDERLLSMLAPVVELKRSVAPLLFLVIAAQTRPRYKGNTEY